MTLLSLLLCRNDASAGSCYGSPHVVVDAQANENKERELVTIKQGRVEDVSNTGSETEGQDHDVIEEVARDTVMVADADVVAADELEQQEVDARDETDALSTEHQEEREAVAEEKEDVEPVLDANEEEEESNEEPATPEDDDDEKPTLKTAQKAPQERSIINSTQSPRAFSNFKLSTLFGDYLMVNDSNDDDDEAVDTNKALAGKAVLAVYIGCGKHKDIVSLFDAGYDAQSLAIVYCWVSNDDDAAADTGFDTMPPRWFMATEDYEMVLEKCSSLSSQDDNDDDEALVIMDPATGNVLCENALPSLLALSDPAQSESLYDTEAESLMQSWIAALNMKQAVIGQMEIPRVPAVRAE